MLFTTTSTKNWLSRAICLHSRWWRLQRIFCWRNRGDGGELRGRGDRKASETNEAAGEGFQKELFHFVHPALDEDDGWKVHKEVERLVKQFDVQEICKRLNILKKEGKVLLPQNTKNAHEELIRMGMPIEKGGFGYKTFCKYYNKD